MKIKSNFSNVIIAAGGTGGHIFPGISLAEILLKEGISVFWIGTTRGLEKKIVPKYKIPLFYLNFGGVRGKSLKQIFLLPFNLSKAIFDSLLILNKIKPNFLICCGGYITVPIGISAKIMGIPFCIHEQNAVMGTANRLLSKLTKDVFINFPDTKYAPKKSKALGNPLRSCFYFTLNPKERLVNREGPFRILILGGSQGASFLNNIIPNVINDANDKKNIFSVIHQTGETEKENVKSLYEKLGLKAEVKSFFSNIIEEYSWADLIISRSGAGVISEIATVGVASILIPLPNSIDNHQLENAKSLEKIGAAYVLEQNEYLVSKLVDILKKLDRHKLVNMSNKAILLGSSSSAKKIVNELKILKNGTSF